MISKVKAAVEQKPLLLFLLTSLALLLSWFVGYYLLLEPDGRLDFWLTELTAKLTAQLLEPWYTLQLGPRADQQVLFLNQQAVLGIAKNCNGLEVFALFTGFILAFPGKIKNKLWFIPLGIALLFILNLIRTVILTLTQLHWPQALDFNHKYTFVVIVYGAMFLLWRAWVNRWSQV